MPSKPSNKIALVTDTNRPPQPKGNQNKRSNFFRNNLKDNSLMNNYKNDIKEEDENEEESNNNKRYGGNIPIIRIDEANDAPNETNEDDSNDLPDLGRNSNESSSNNNGSKMKNSNKNDAILISHQKKVSSQKSETKQRKSSPTSGNLKVNRANSNATTKKSGEKNESTEPARGSRISAERNNSTTSLNESLRFRRSSSLISSTSSQSRNDSDTGVECDMMGVPRVDRFLSIYEIPEEVIQQSQKIFQQRSSGSFSKQIGPNRASNDLKKPNGTNNSKQIASNASKIAAELASNPTNNRITNATTTTIERKDSINSRANREAASLTKNNNNLSVGGGLYDLKSIKSVKSYANGAGLTNQRKREIIKEILKNYNMEKFIEDFRQSNVSVIPLPRQ